MNRERNLTVAWGCGCPIETGLIPPVETKCTSVQRKGKTVITGFVERCSRCQKHLGDGYGDINHFDTIKKAEEFVSQFKIGVWWRESS